MKIIQLLSNTHDRKGFDCGETALNQFLQSIARQHIQKGLSRTFVLVDDLQPSVIIGFFTLSLCEVQVDYIPPRWAKKYPSVVPGVKLARLYQILKCLRQLLPERQVALSPLSSATSYRNDISSIFWTISILALDERGDRTQAL